MKVIIAGSRTIRSHEPVIEAIVMAQFDITEVVCGEALGPDINGKTFAEINGIPVKSFPADWKKHGKAAGPIRNKAMADYADALIAIWDGKSKGTKNMIDLMEEQNKPIYVNRV